MKRNGIVLLCALAISTNALSWPWSRKTEKKEESSTGPTKITKKEEKKNGNSTQKTTEKKEENKDYKYRSVRFKNNNEMNQKCNTTCGKHKEEWTGRVKSAWFGWGQKCECKPRKRSWFGKSKTEKEEGVQDRWAGFYFKNPPEDLANECPKVCGKHQEKATGKWTRGRLGGYWCSCKVAKEETKKA
jgi:hypothetical protein